MTRKMSAFVSTCSFALPCHDALQLFISLAPGLDDLLYSFIAFPVKGRCSVRGKRIHVKKPVDQDFGIEEEGRFVKIVLLPVKRKITFDIEPDESGLKCYCEIIKFSLCVDVFGEWRILK